MTRILSALLLLAACNDSAKSDGTERLRKVATEGPFETVTMYEIARAYKDNQVAADGRFMSHGLNVSGAVSAVITDKDGVPMVFLGPTPNENLVGCAGVQRSNAARLSPGQGVYMKGVGVGATAGIPMLLYCEVQ